MYKDLVMTKFVKLFAADESGATAIEYGLIAAGISVAIIGILGTMSTSIIATFQAVIDAMA